VSKVVDETKNARSFWLRPHHEFEEFFKFRPGQFLNFRVPYKGKKIDRSYSISSIPDDGPELRVCVKRVPAGICSNWLNDHLNVGDEIEASRPAGRFVLQETERPLFLVAGGSGITPCISLVKSALHKTQRRVKLLFANRDLSSAIYHQELEGLASSYADRFVYINHLDSEIGLLTDSTLKEHFNNWFLAHVYICAPQPLMDLAEKSLAELFGEDATIITERFLSSWPDTDEKTASETKFENISPQLRITLDGNNFTFNMSPGQTILEAAVAAGLDLPSNCSEGHCGACMGILRKGQVQMASKRALSEGNIKQGYVLACQARPVSSIPLWIDYD
jgi:3-ketosteroid 9alpha-monooxygenase subunit B